MDDACFATVGGVNDVVILHKSPASIWHQNINQETADNTIPKYPNEFQPTQLPENECDQEILVNESEENQTTFLQISPVQIEDGLVDGVAEARAYGSSSRG